MFKSFMGLLLRRNPISRIVSYLFFVYGRTIATRHFRAEFQSSGSTLASKISYKMAWDRNPLLRVFGDKYSVRKYISDRIGEQYLVPLIGIWESPKKIPWASMPSEFVIKVTHGSGGVIVVSESAPPNDLLPRDVQGWTRFQVTPDNFDSRVAEMLLAHWKTLRYEWWPGRRPEYAYRGLRPRIMVEKLIRPIANGGKSPGALLEIKAFTFNGLVQFFEVYLGTFGAAKKIMYLDKTGNRLPVRVFDHQETWPEILETPPLPWLSKVIELSERLATDIDFVRVDFLTAGEDVYVGEITNYPACGDDHYEPEHFNTFFGATWNPQYRT